MPTALMRTVTGSAWDQFRTKLDTTGLIERTIALMPAPNDLERLNNGAHRRFEHCELPVLCVASEAPTTCSASAKPQATEDRST